MITAINIGGDNRSQEDKIGLRVRKRLIENGSLTPGKPSALPPFMHPDAVIRTKQHLIKHGVIVPFVMKPVSEGHTTKELIAARKKINCAKCRANIWLCPCGSLE